MQVPKDAKVIVACQKGLRSLAAAEQLSRAGYNELAWVNGGLDNSQPGEVPTRDGNDIRYAGIGGVSEMVGWTEVQQENAGPAGSLKSVFIAVRPSPELGHTNTACMVQAWLILPHSHCCLTFLCTLLFSCEH